MENQSESAEFEKASCLCGSVKITAKLKSATVQACHCKQCQCWTGGGPLYVVPVDDISFEGSEHISRFHVSEHGERGFCRQCGTTLYWSMKGEKPSSIPVGLLADQDRFEISEEIFIDHRPSWLPMCPTAKQSTEEEELVLLERYLAKKGVIKEQC